MPVHFLRTPTTPPEIMALELTRFADNKGLQQDDAAINQKFIESVIAAFRAKVLAYHNAGATDADRLQRLIEISQTIREICFTDGANQFTTAAGNANVTAEEAWASGGVGCTPPLTCVDRQCQ